MKAHRILALLTLAFTLGACAKGGSSSSPSVSVSNVLTYQRVTVDALSGSPNVEDLAYVELEKSRLIVADFNVCFRVISLSAEDIAGLREAMIYATTGQDQAQAACSASSDAYVLASSVNPATLTLCQTDLKDQLDAIMARPGQRLCKPLSSLQAE